MRLNSLQAELCNRCLLPHSRIVAMTGSTVWPRAVSRYSTFGGTTLYARRWIRPSSTRDLSSRLSTLGAIPFGLTHPLANSFLSAPNRSDPSRSLQRIRSLYFPRIISGSPPSGNDGLLKSAVRGFAELIRVPPFQTPRPEPSDSIPRAPTVLEAVPSERPCAPCRPTKN